MNYRCNRETQAYILGHEPLTFHYDVKIGDNVYHRVRNEGWHVQPVYFYTTNKTGAKVFGRDDIFFDGLGELLSNDTTYHILGDHKHLPYPASHRNNGSRGFGFSYQNGVDTGLVQIVFDDLEVRISGVEIYRYLFHIILTFPITGRWSRNKNLTTVGAIKRCDSKEEVKENLVHCLSWFISDANDGFTLSSVPKYQELMSLVDNCLAEV